MPPVCGEGLSTRKPQAKTGIAHADFARIRNAKLDRFTIHRLMTILNRVGQQVDVQIDVPSRAQSRAEKRLPHTPRAASCEPAFLAASASSAQRAKAARPA
jgi:hypothetical protein